MNEFKCFKCGKELKCDCGAVSRKVQPLVSREEIQEIADLTVRLVELRQNECKHLAVENIAPEIFHKLLTRLTMHKDGILVISDDRELNAG